MPTLKQIVNKKIRKARKVRDKKLALQQCPQRRGACTKVYTLTPKKPCSARRAVCRVKLSNKKMVFCHIPGVGHNLKKFSVVLVRGGRPNDLPSVRYRVIRGARKTDLHPVVGRHSCRSIYGIRNTSRLHKVRKNKGKGEQLYLISYK